MRRVSLSIRVTRAQDAAVRAYLASSGLASRYQAASRIFEAGLNALVGHRPAEGPRPDADLIDALGEILARLGRQEALLHRALFTASAAYVYGRHAALRLEPAPGDIDQELAAKSEAAYQRQKKIWEGSL